ncbi:hypothetical protein INR49_000395 [Caranx melampygus]|nr:hypothetical protein INR49_000395 [Caranx melampygus]
MRHCRASRRSQKLQSAAPPAMVPSRTAPPVTVEDSLYCSDVQVGRYKATRIQDGVSFLESQHNEMVPVNHSVG